MKKILLDIDGVLVLTPSWKVPEIHKDGFMEFHKPMCVNLSYIIEKTMLTEIVLISSHRNKYNSEQWLEIMNNRNINIPKISMINPLLNKIEGIKEWVNNNITNNFIILDDDSMFENLPFDIKNKWFKTSPYHGITLKITNEVIDRLNDNLYFLCTNPQ